jgi:hypothetical protein
VHTDSSNSSTGTEGPSSLCTPLACDASVLDDNVGVNIDTLGKEGAGADQNIAPDNAAQSSVSQNESFQDG